MVDNEQPIFDKNTPAEKLGHEEKKSKIQMLGKCSALG